MSLQLSYLVKNGRVSEYNLIYFTIPNTTHLNHKTDRTISFCFQRLLTTQKLI